MKLVIDVPKWVYKRVKEWSEGNYDIIHPLLGNAFKKGTPLPKEHGRLIDATVLKKNILKWLPPDPCGKEEREFPYETDIVVSVLQEIDETPTILKAEGSVKNESN